MDPPMSPWEWKGETNKSLTGSVLIEQTANPAWEFTQALLGEVITKQTIQGQVVRVSLGGGVEGQR